MTLVSIVVPTVTGREESLERLLASYVRHHGGFEHEIIVVRDRPTVGVGWQEGAERARGDYLHLTNDDLEAHASTLATAVETVEAGKLPCATVFFPDGRVQTPRAGMVDWRPTGPWEHGCHVPFLSRAQWGIVRPLIPLHYRVEPWMSHVAKQRAGIDTVLRLGYAFTHHNHPVGRGAGMGSERARLDHDRREYERYLAAEPGPPCG